MCVGGEGITIVSGPGPPPGYGPDVYVYMYVCVYVCSSMSMYFMYLCTLCIYLCILCTLCTYVLLGVTCECSKGVGVWSVGHTRAPVCLTSGRKGSLDGATLVGVQYLALECVSHKRQG